MSQRTAAISFLKSTTTASSRSSPRPTSSVSSVPVSPLPVPTRSTSRLPLPSSAARPQALPSAAAWIDEGGALTFGDATFAQINLDAHKLHVAVKVTEELLYDSAFPLEKYIVDEFGKALANAEEDAFLNGNGTGKPLGILAATGGAEIGVTAASSTTITADEIINLIYSLKRPYRKKAVFITNDATLAILRKLKDGNGKLLGYPVYTSQFMPAVAAGSKSVIFGDISYYNIGDRGTRSFAELRELFAGNGMIGYVAKERVDGKLVLPEAVKVLQQKA